MFSQRPAITRNQWSRNMTSNRREIIKAGLLGSAAVAAGLPQIANAAEKQTEVKPLNILVLGGTGFLGPHMVREALRRGHTVTLFNRGRTNNTLFPDLQTIKGDRDNGLDGLKGQSWDAVVDNSGYVPRLVEDSARLLADHTDRYVYTSTVSVYADFKVKNDESSPLATIEDEGIEEVTNETYGALKALCEKRAASEIAAERLTIIRPTFVCGPGDSSDRFTYWPVRARKGGQMIWPGTPDDVIQIVDVRDLASFTIDCVDHNISGIYNAVNPEGKYKMNDMLADCRAVSASKFQPIWISEAFAYERGLIAKGKLPIWEPKGGELGGAEPISGLAARNAGLRNRPERETVRDVLAWWDTLSVERQNNMKAGMSAEREAEEIAAWKQFILV
jgi:2'-hydroxyisoflavone reductase